MIKLVIYGLTGSGKSSSAGIVRSYFTSRGRTVAVLKLAQPLYELQQQFYQAAGQTIGMYEQDQVLLEIIATQLRRISPTSLAEHFLARLALVDADVVLNDDLRDAQIDYPMLKQQGFRFIRIACPETVRLQRLQQRKDISVVTHSATTIALDQIEPDVVVDNASSNMADLQAKIHAVLPTLR
jgi:cytidine deaminase